MLGERSRRGEAVVLTAELEKKGRREGRERGGWEVFKKDGQTRRLGLVELGEAGGWHLTELELRKPGWMPGSRLAGR